MPAKPSLVTPPPPTFSSVLAMVGPFRSMVTRGAPTTSPAAPQPDRSFATRMLLVIAWPQ